MTSKTKFLNKEYQQETAYLDHAMAARELEQSMQLRHNE